MSRVGKIVDWEAIQRDYRVGQMSLRELATTHGINHVSIKKRADKENWPKDLALKINAKASELVNAANTRVTNKNNTDDEIVLIKGTEVAQIRLGHRRSIDRAQTLANALMAELETQTFDAVLMAELGELMRSPNDDGSDRLNDIYKKIISTPGRIDSAKKLVEAMRSLITMEREAYNIGVDANETPANSVAAFLASMKRSALPVVYEIEQDDSH